MIRHSKAAGRAPWRPGASVLLGLFAALVVLLTGLRHGYAIEPEVAGIRFGLHGERTRIVIDFDRRVEPHLAVRDSPPRLVIDLPEVRFRVREHPLGRPRGLAAGHRYGRLEPGRSRIVIDLRQPFRVAGSSLLPPSRDSRYWRLVLDLEALPAVAEPPADRRQLAVPGPPPETKSEGGEGSGAVGVAPVDRPPPTDGAQVASPRVVAVPVPRPVPGARTTERRPVVVLDPGHGGIDPGAIGVNGEPEKELTLRMAKELRRELQRSGRYEVHLTREDDRFIPLRERVAIARRLGADLLLSLHADSIEDRNVHGASVYTVSEIASDAEAERLASKENRADVLAGVDLSVQDEIVAEILIDLARRDTNNKSIVFAETLIAEIDGVTPLLKRTRRYAGFAVLKSPDTPSVLLELGYLSNPRDAARLSDAAYRQRLAGAIARAIDRYFDHLRPPL